MKVKNIVFSGVMGAILATAANAAPTIASKNYVDSFVGAREAVLQNQISANVTAIDNHADLINANTAAISDMDAAYKAADEATLSSANAYTDQEINALEQNLSTTGGDVTALALRVKANEDNIATHTTDIATNASGVADNKAAIEAINNAETGLLSQAKAYTDQLADGAVATNTADIATLKGDATTEGSVAKAIADAISASETTASNTYATKIYVDEQDTALDTRVKANEDYIAQHKTDYSTLTQTVADNKTAAENAVKALADNAVKANTDAIATLNGTGDGSVAKAVEDSASATKTAYETYAIPKPNLHECNAASGLCVLSYDKNGSLQWVDVTENSTGGGSSSGGFEITDGDDWGDDNVSWDEII